jgi:hypothetical protein
MTMFTGVRLLWTCVCAVGAAKCKALETACGLETCRDRFPSCARHLRELMSVV